MRVPLLAVFLCLSMVGLAQGQDRAVGPQRLGDLLVELVGASAPSELVIGQGKSPPPPERYWVVAQINFRNEGSLAVCANFSGSLTAEYGLVARTDAFPNNVTPISELLPGGEAKRNFIFTLKRGANPLELTVQVLSYGAECGNRLPRSTALSVRFPVRGVSSPKDDKFAAGASLAPATAPRPPSGGGCRSGAYQIGSGVSAPRVLVKVEPEYSEEARNAKWQGTVVLSVTVDENGTARCIKVTKPLGMGLDQKAIEAAMKWRFKPGMKNGIPVPVVSSIEVNFRLL